MQFFVIQRVLGLLILVFSVSQLIPMAVSWVYGDGVTDIFVKSSALFAIAGILLLLPVWNYKRELRLRDGFVVVMMFWLVLGLSGAVPLVLSETPRLSVTDAVFEAISGLTTTGATVITGLDDLPISILFYRQFLQWLGGMGIIVLAVAILPVLGIGGMQLYRAETPGPMKDSKLTPRIAETAKALWYIYLSLTVLCALGYWMAGMSGFDALMHSFSTVAIGGFSTHDASLGYFDSDLINAIAILFMLISGANFSLHFMAWRQISITPYSHDPEFKAYIWYLLGVAAITSAILYYNHNFNSTSEDISKGIFQAISFGTTTGFTTSNYNEWPSFLPVILIFSSFIGGCAGSTGGGMKVIRVILMFKQGAREISRLIHPNAIIPIKIGNNPLPYRVIDAVWGFFAAYVATFTIMMLLILMSGVDQVTAFSAVAACINNLGPGLGEVAQNYSTIPDPAKWILCVAMLLGRLEIFTLLVVISPAFWRR